MIPLGKGFKRANKYEAHFCFRSCHMVVVIGGVISCAFFLSNVDCEGVIKRKSLSILHVSHFALREKKIILNYFYYNFIHFRRQPILLSFV